MERSFWNLCFEVIKEMDRRSLCEIFVTIDGWRIPEDSHTDDTQLAIWFGGYIYFASPWF